VVLKSDLEHTLSQLVVDDDDDDDDDNETADDAEKPTHSVPIVCNLLVTLNNAWLFTWCGVVPTRL